MGILLAVVVSYLLGSIPTAYLAGRFLKGIDIRQHGSGNVGATNAFRVLGKTPGTVVFVVDVLKGVLAMTLIGDSFGVAGLGTRLLLAVAVVCGHNWTIFLQFKGGKGIATSLGVLIGLTIKFPVLLQVLLLTVAIWVVMFWASGYVSLASIIAAVALPLIMVFTHQAGGMILLGVVFCLFVVFRHRTNIERLLSGKESQASFRSRRKKKR